VKKFQFFWKPVSSADTGAVDRHVTGKCAEWGLSRRKEM